MPRTIAFINQKGGVGKTTTVLALAGALAAAGKRVLVVDVDSQANASQTLLPDWKARVDSGDLLTTNDLMQQDVDPADLPEAITATAWPGVDLIPSEQNLASRESEGTTGVETRLRRVLRGIPADTYDAVLIDCPPSLGRLTVNALLAANEVMLLCLPDAYSQAGLVQIQNTLKVLSDSYEHNPNVLGVIVNQVEATKEAQMRLGSLSEQFGDDLLLTVPKRTVITLAAGSNQPLTALRRPDAQAIAGLFDGLARRIGLLPQEPNLSGPPTVIDMDSAAVAAAASAV